MTERGRAYHRALLRQVSPFVNRVRANLLLLVISLIWGAAFVAQSQAMADVGPMLFTGVRFLIGALVVLPLMVIEWRGLQKQSQPLQNGDWLKIGGLGGLLLLGAALQQIGIKTTSITNAGFLTSL